MSSRKLINWLLLSLLVSSCKTTKETTQAVHTDSLCLVSLSNLQLTADSIVFRQEVETVGTTDSTVPYRKNTTAIIYKPNVTKKDSTTLQETVRDSARTSSYITTSTYNPRPSVLYQLLLLLLALLGLILIARRK